MDKELFCKIAGIDGILSIKDLIKRLDEAEYWDASIHETDKEDYVAQIILEFLEEGHVPVFKRHLNVVEEVKGGKADQRNLFD